MVTTGDGIMFAASICYVFKRLAFQDWTIFNERYANNKVVGQTNATKDSEPGKAMADIVANFNSDQGIVLYEAQSTDKPPISLLGPEGTTSVDLFERFLDRQDGKMSVMYRGSDRANTAGEKKDNGISAQMEETERLEMAHCQRIADACQQGIDRQVIRYVFGEGVEPLAYFGLPDMDAEDAAQVRASAGFLADRGALVEADEIAERLGVTLTEDPALALQVTGKRQSATGDPEAQEFKTANAARRKAEARLEQHIEAALLRTGNSNPNHDEKGKFAKGHSLSVKGQSKELTREQQKESIDAALAAADRGDQESFSLGRVPESLAARVRSGTQSDVREIGGAELRIDSDFVTHARAYHPNLTDADFHRIPELMNEADSVRPNTTKSGNLPAVEFHKRLGARDHQLIGASLNKKGHFKMTTLKKSAEDQAS